jgi:hypothetical protein
MRSTSFLCGQERDDFAKQQTFDRLVLRFRLATPGYRLVARRFLLTSGVEAVEVHTRLCRGDTVRP